MVCNTLMHFNSIEFYENIMHVFKIIHCYVTNTIINPYIVGIQTKGKFPCLVCGPRMKYHRSSLGNEVFIKIGTYSIRTIGIK